MSTYKVIQDIEAEDHILGPLSLRQFIFAIIAVLCFYFCYLLVSKHVALLTPLFFLPGVFAAFFAFPFGKDQPTEVWALAKIRFLFKPRRRIWDQSGVKELVTVTVPKKVEEHLTNGLSENEVRSRLSALANTIDSRGWAVKNVNVNISAQPGFTAGAASSDRLVNADSMPQEVPNYDVQAADDIMDEQNNPIAHQFDQMITASSQAHRQQLVSMMNQPAPAAPTSTPTAPPSDYWFMQPATNPAATASSPIGAVSAPIVLPGGNGLLPSVPAAEPTAEEKAFAAQLKSQQHKPDPTYAHLKTIMPLRQQQQPQPAPAPFVPLAPAVASAPVAATTTPVQSAMSDATTQRLANNNDLNVATIAREAHRSTNEVQHFGDDEVVIALH